MKKKIICLFCILAVILSLCACSKDNEPTTTEITEESTVEESTDTETVEQKNVILPFTSKATLNPYTTESNINRYLVNLVFDPLFRLNEEYEPVEMIASSYEIDGNIVTVELRDDIMFSNGEMLNTRDIIYSYQQAKSSPLFSQRLSNFYSCSADGDNIIFNITTPDIFAANCLDFPIVKFGSATDEIPTGSGRYILSKEKNGYMLKVNENYVLDEEMEQEKINLLDLNTIENELYPLQIGELTCVFKDFNGSKQSKISASKQQVGLNNLVYLGINSEKSVFSDINIRNAISCGIDNASIADNAYDGLARACKTPFNPSWSKASIFENSDFDYDISTASDYLDKSGYVYEYKNNKFRSKNFKYLTLNLIVNKENPGKVTCARLIESQLEAIGIEVKLFELDYETYLERLQLSDYDLYIGEVKLTPNMDLSVFFNEKGTAGYGINRKSPVRGAYKDFIAGTVDISTFNKVFDEVKPFIPICYRDAAIYYSRSLKYEDTASENDIYSNIYSWSF